MPERPHIDDVTAWLKRRGKYANPRARIDRLQQAWRTRKNDDFCDFVPIHLATILEAYIQSSVKDLVERGDPFFERSKKIMQFIKLDFDYLSALQGKKISVGDLAAHAISVTSLENIMSVLSTLLGDSFKERLLTVQSRLAVELLNQPARPIISDFPVVARNLSKLFEARHILVHELPETKPYGIEEVNAFIDSCEKFCSAVEEVISAELFGNYPITQADMNQRATSDCDSAVHEMDTALEAVRKLPDVDLRCLESSQESWKEFSKRESEFQASVVEGGSLYPLVYAASMEQLVRARIAQIRYWMEREEGDL